MKSSLYDTPSKYIWNIIKIMKAQVDGSIISTVFDMYTSTIITITFVFETKIDEHIANLMEFSFLLCW